MVLIVVLLTVLLSVVPNLSARCELELVQPQFQAMVYLGDTFPPPKKTNNKNTFLQLWLRLLFLLSKEGPF